ncbi:Zinc finger BED domain-containing protein 5 [Labeo rohita]|uniref:Zinc finger BED domain-containing protein 5 n=1 Tax=Labeo rohita TaxID=84645 RepID=A0ABQ8MMQ7_LABRO|nr:Zinc finger BED domain-containing protein 5 [Labeo rohita]
MCRIMVEEEAINKITFILLSNDTVSKWTKNISSGVKSQLTERLRLCEQFTLQHDECINVSSTAQLLHFYGGKTSELGKMMAKLAYLADIFRCLNGLNLSIQGSYSTILEANVMASGLSRKAEDELLELSSDRTPRMRFNQQGPAKFWPTVEKEYNEVALQAIRILFPFPITYLCETLFSAMMVIKSLPSPVTSRITLTKALMMAPHPISDSAHTAPNDKTEHIRRQTALVWGLKEKRKKDYDLILLQWGARSPNPSIHI